MANLRQMALREARKAKLRRECPALLKDGDHAWKEVAGATFPDGIARKVLACPCGYRKILDEPPSK